MKTELRQAAEFYRIEQKFMAEHGWTEAEYIKRYGTTEEPIMGDGGALIWEADLNALFRARDHFLKVLQKYWHRKGGHTSWRKQCPLAAELWDSHLLGLPRDIDTIHSRRAAAAALVQSMRHSIT